MDVRSSEWSLDREIVLSRVFDAPRELVWQAWTDKEHIGKWFGPKGFAIETREIDWIRVKGKLQPVAIYELVGERDGIDERRREAFKRYAEGLHLYRGQRWTEAAAAFAQALSLDPADGPSLAMAARCDYYRAHAPDAWDGVHVMHSK